jgi:hypothetical protein
MAYTRGMPGARHLRERLAHVSSLTELDQIAATTVAAAAG